MKANIAWIAAAALLGITLGVGSYAFIYARGYSYLSNDPGACTNCHVMRASYNGWITSSHHAAATCNDCHTPSNPVTKYATKTSNGFFHSLAFTSGRFPDAIQIKARNHAVTEGACRNCHQQMVTAIEGVHKDVGSVSCLHCHASVGHSDAMAWSPISSRKGYYK
jgi:cytochrome c nitrite reductase small subunit